MADQSPTESDSSTTPEFPDKMRVHALAKLLGVTSKQVLAEAAALGTELRSAQSSLQRDVAQRIHASLTSAAEAIEPVVAELDSLIDPVVEARLPRPLLRKSLLQRLRPRSLSGLVAPAKRSLSKNRPPKNLQQKKQWIRLSPRSALDSTPLLRCRARKPSSPICSLPSRRRRPISPRWLPPRRRSRCSCSRISKPPR